MAVEFPSGSVVMFSGSLIGVTGEDLGVDGWIRNDQAVNLGKPTRRIDLGRDRRWWVLLPQVIEPSVGLVQEVELTLLRIALRCCFRSG